MDNQTFIHFTWADLLLAAAVFLVLYFTLRFAARLLTTARVSGKYQEALSSGIRHILLVYEPLVLLISGSIFILINPIFHGLTAVLLLVGGFSYLKDYVSGRIIQLDNKLSPGKRLSFRNIKGIITELGRLGLQLNTGKGLQFIPYTELYSNGYMVLSGNDVGGFYTLNIKPDEPDSKVNYITFLTDRLVSAPYLDQNLKPDILQSEEADDLIKVKILVKEEKHLIELIKLIREWGFSCKISNK